MTKLTHLLMNSVYDRVTFSPPDSNYGVHAQEEQWQQEGEDDEDVSFDNSSLDDEDGDGNGEGGEGGDSNDDPEITGDVGEFMSDLFKAGDDEDEEEKAESPEEIAALETKMATDLTNGLKSLTLDASIIPEDFDVNDRSQLLSLLTQVQINTAENAIKLMFAPVQQTLNRMSTTMRREMRETSRSGHDAVAERDAVAAAFPGVSNPVIAPAIQFALKAARAKHPGDRKAQFSSMRKALDALGIKGYDKAVGRDNAEGANGLRTGPRALDFLGLRLPQPTRSSAQDRMRKSGK